MTIDLMPGDAAELLDSISVRYLDGPSGLVAFGSDWRDCAPMYLLLAKLIAIALSDDVLLGEPAPENEG